MIQPRFENGICQGINTELYYPEVSHFTKENILAKRLCLQCPELDACREYAIETFQWGIWGATNDNERRRIRDKRSEEENNRERKSA